MAWPAPAHNKAVVAAIIAALAIGYFTGLWSLLGEWLGELLYLLAESTLVPNWLLGIFAICAIIVAGMLGASLRPTRRRAERPSRIHAQDNFFNIKWRWSYDESGGVQHLTPYCRHCDHQLVLKNVGGSRAIGYECRCDHCGALACELDCSIEEFEGRVLHRIDQAG